MLRRAGRDSVVARAETLLDAARRRARVAGRPQMASLVSRIPVVDPLLLFERSAESKRFYWRTTSSGLALAGVGSAAGFDGRGRPALGAVVGAWRTASRQCLVDADPTFPMVPPVAVGGYAFDPDGGPDPVWREYPDVSFDVPRTAIVTCGGSAWICFSAEVGPDADPGRVAQDLERDLEAAEAWPRWYRRDPAAEPEHVVEAGPEDAWTEAVERALDAIGSGRIDKVVLARCEVRTAGRKLDAVRALRRLRMRYGDGMVFGVARAASCFLGATPELLARVRGNEVEAACIAGSRRRGLSAAVDQAEGEALLGDAKEQHEHRLVLEELRRRLATIGRDLRIGDGPDLLRLPNVQHLRTRLTATAARATGVLEVADALHPTPATCGLPTGASLAMIRELEGQPRGWYAGGVGWIDGEGSGELGVAIRSALVEGATARLYSGCGIVAESQAARELDESRLKLEPMRWALR